MLRTVLPAARTTIAESWLIGDSSRTKKTLRPSASSSCSRFELDDLPGSARQDLANKLWGRIAGITTGTSGGNRARNHGSTWSMCSWEIKTAVVRSNSGVRSAWFSGY